MAVLGAFLVGGFFGGGFFGQRLEATDQDDKPSLKKIRSIYKPTGLPPYRETVERRVQETREIAREVSKEAKTLRLPKPIKQMSLTEIEREIAVRLQQKYLKEEDEALIMILASAL